MRSYRADPEFKERAVANFLRQVAGTIRESYDYQKDQGGLTQAALGRLLDTRSSINRQLSGTENLTLRRIAEFAWGMGFEPELVFHDISVASGNNAQPAGNINNINVIKPDPGRATINNKEEKFRRVSVE